MEELFVAEEGESGTMIGTLNEKRWAFVKVLSRVRELYDPKLLRAGATKRRRLYDTHTVTTATYESAETDAQRQEELIALSHKTVKRVYVGYSVYMMGPMFVRAPRGDSTDATDATLENVNHFNFRGCEFKREPGGHLNGSKTLVHYKACSIANFFLALKQLGAGSTIGHVFREGDKSLIEYCQSPNQFMSDASRGEEIRPVSLFEEPNPGDFDTMVRDRNDIYTPATSLPPSGPGGPQPRYPRNEHMLCNGTLLARDGSNGPKGYKLGIPYTATLEYPAELLTMLEKLA